MPVLIIETCINASRERCFDLARDIDLHCATARQTKERAVAGVTSGLIGLGQSVTFEGIHFGLRLRLTARVTEFDRPYRFVDEMTQGAFQSMRHTHEFLSSEQGTRMKDTLQWTSPFGMFGVIADRLFLKRHLHTFLLQRNAALKSAAEGVWTSGVEENKAGTDETPW